jgi:uncharacterized protein YndB with AHSA1/START domain
MPSIDTIDSIEIRADAQRIFDVILDYPNMQRWFPSYRCALVGASGKVREGSRVEHWVGKPPLVMSHFVRTIRKVVPGQRIEETYDEGPMRGTGVWTFEQSGATTRVSYHCAVRSVTLGMHIGFLLTGAKAHNMVYQKLLRALKKRCEAA